MRDKAVIAGISHRRIEKPVDDEDACFFIQFIFDRLAANRNFNEDIDLMRRIETDGNCVKKHILLQGFYLMVSRSPRFLSKGGGGDRQAHKGSPCRESPE